MQIKDFYLKFHFDARNLIDKSNQNKILPNNKQVI